jgi:hypothetical protein
MRRGLTALTSLLVYVGAALAALLSSGCVSPTNAVKVQEVVPFTDRVLYEADLRKLGNRVVLGDEAYAEVNSAWLKEWHGDFRAQIFRLGVVRWNQRYDCNRFAEIYTGLAQIAYFRVTFHRETPAKALAIGPYWYVTQQGRSHAIVQAITERGRIFIDPQPGREVQLTGSEQRSTFLQVF